MKKYIGIGVLAALLLVPLLIRFSAEDRGVKVTVAAVDKRTVQATILASGTIGYDSKVSLSPEVIGQVTAVLVKEGDAVQKGQPLLKIDDRTLRAQLAEGEARLRVQRLTIEQQAANLTVRDRQLGRVKELLNRGFAPRASYDDQKYSQKAADVQLRLSREGFVQESAALQQIREQLNKTIVRAPMSGTVIAVNIKAGETAVPSAIGIAGSSLMTIADTGTLIAELNVDEADIASVSSGQSAQLHVLAYPDIIVPGRIVRVPISPKQANLTLSAAENQARAYIVKTAIQDRPGVALRPGMSCRAEINTLTRKAVLTGPVEAVLRQDSDNTVKPVRQSANHDAEKTYVFIAAEGKVQKRFIQTGLSDDVHQEVERGIRAGEYVVVGPAKELRVLRSGDRISVGRSLTP